MDTAHIDWYRIPVEKSDLQRFTQKSDVRGWLQTGSFLLIFAATTMSACFFFTARQWLPMIAVCIIHSLFMNMMSTAAASHELSHGTVFKSRAVNEFFYNLFCVLTWNNPVHFRASHMLHHQLTVYRGLDKEVVQRPVSERMNLVNYLSWCTFDYKSFALFMRINFLHALGKGDAEFYSWDPLFSSDDPRRKAMCNWARVIVFSHLAILAACVIFKIWVLIYLLIFGGFFVSVLANLTVAIQHTGLGSNRPDWRLVCHTVRVNPVVGYLYWHMNYHTEHHMYAAVPFFKLAQFHRAVSGGMQVPQKSLLAGLRLLLLIKKKQRQDPSYTYVPEFPPTAAPPHWQ